MKLNLFLIFNILCYSEPFEEVKFLLFECHQQNVKQDYHTGEQDFSIRLFKKVAKQNAYHFALSQYSIWLSLSALAEGTIDENQRKVLKLLNLPEKACLRENYYEIATSIESSAEDVQFERKRLLFLDNSLNVNMSWVYEVGASGLVRTNITSLSEENFPNQVRELTNISNFEFHGGNAVLLDALDYNGLWTDSFENSTEIVDFHDDNGDKIGTVEMMKVKKRVKLLSFPFTGSKILELPVGNAGRFKMIFIMGTGKNSIRRTIEHFPNTFLIDALNIIIESTFPLEIGIPKFRMESLIDLRGPLKEMGFENLWSVDSNILISEPPAVPSTILQRVTVALGPEGLERPKTNSFTFGREFYANRPFVYGLIDSETRTWLFSGVYSKPQR